MREDLKAWSSARETARGDEDLESKPFGRKASTQS